MKFIKKYKFSDKNHSLKGSVSTLMGLCSLGLCIFCVVDTTGDHGKSGLTMGALAMLAAGLAVVGCVLGLLSFKEEEKYYLTSKIGSLLCGILSVFYLAVLMMGLGL